MSYQDFIDHYHKHLSHVRFVNIRKHYCSGSEPLWHEIQLLKSERQLALLLKQNLVAIMTSPLKEVREIFEQFRNGPLTGEVIKNQLSWEQLFLNIDTRLLKLEKKYSKACRLEQELLSSF